ncbi:MAG: hypothetical protein R2731_16505 [Nocardioides sp.]
MLSIVAALLEEPASSVTLVYANRTQAPSCSSTRSVT